MQVYVEFSYLFLSFNSNMYIYWFVKLQGMPDEYVLFSFFQKGTQEVLKYLQSKIQGTYILKVIQKCCEIIYASLSVLQI